MPFRRPVKHRQPCGMATWRQIRIMADTHTRTSGQTINVASMLAKMAAERPYQRAVVVATGRDGNGYATYAGRPPAVPNARGDADSHDRTGRCYARGWWRSACLRRPCGQRNGRNTEFPVRDGGPTETSHWWRSGCRCRACLAPAAQGDGAGRYSGLDGLWGHEGQHW